MPGRDLQKYSRHFAHPARAKTRKAPALAGAFRIPFDRRYLPAFASELETFENVVLSCPPREFTTAIIATEMPAAIRPYSMAVAPDSSFAKRLTRVFIVFAPYGSTVWLSELCLPGLVRCPIL